MYKYALAMCAVMCVIVFFRQCNINSVMGIQKNEKYISDIYNVFAIYWNVID